MGVEMVGGLAWMGCVIAQRTWELEHASLGTSAKIRSGKSKKKRDRFVGRRGSFLSTQWFGRMG